MAVAVLAEVHGCRVGHASKMCKHYKKCGQPHRPKIPFYRQTPIDSELLQTVRDCTLRAIQTEKSYEFARLASQSARYVLGRKPNATGRAQANQREGSRKPIFISAVFRKAIGITDPSRVRTVDHVIGEILIVQSRDCTRDPTASDLEFAILAKSHLLVQHLLKQLERHQRERHHRQRRPSWLSAFVHQVAALFEPLSGVGRVGTHCEFGDEGWEARLYLGSTEIVGGKDDGHAQMVGFELDLIRLRESFTNLDEFRWDVAASKNGSNSSFLTLRGSVDQHKLCLKVYSRPPKDAGPAFRQHNDGTLDLIGE